VIRERGQPFHFLGDSGSVSDPAAVPGMDAICGPSARVSVLIVSSPSHAERTTGGEAPLTSVEAGPYCSSVITFGPSVSDSPACHHDQPPGPIDQPLGPIDQPPGPIDQPPGPIVQPPGPIVLGVEAGFVVVEAGPVGSGPDVLAQGGFNVEGFSLSVPGVLAQERSVCSPVASPGSAVSPPGGCAGALGLFVPGDSAPYPHFSLCDSSFDFFPFSVLLFSFSGFSFSLFFFLFGFFFSGSLVLGGVLTDGMGRSSSRLRSSALPSTWCSLYIGPFSSFAEVLSFPFVRLLRFSSGSFFRRWVAFIRFFLCAPLAGFSYISFFLSSYVGRPAFAPDIGF
jgi:hypothetical protein